MDITITKGERQDRIDVRRSDGSATGFSFPHKGPMPHDVVHFIVESTLGLDRGFWGMVAMGCDPQAIGAMAKEAGHASAKRAVSPDPAFVEIIQVERLVEAFEADQWGGGSDNEAVRSMAASACEQSHVPPLELADTDISQIRASLASFRDHWQSRSVGAIERLAWERPVVK